MVSVTINGCTKPPRQWSYKGRQRPTRQLHVEHIIYFKRLELPLIGRLYHIFPKALLELIFEQGMEKGTRLAKVDTDLMNSWLVVDTFLSKLVCHSTRLYTKRNSSQPTSYAYTQPTLILKRYCVEGVWFFFLSNHFYWLFLAWPGTFTDLSIYTI